MAPPLDAAKDLRANATVVKGSPRGRIEAPHGGAIVALAVTSDGTAAVSVDELGGIRLWPALDGTTEPRVMELPRPRDLVIAREPRGFAVTVIDEVGGLAVHVVGTDGQTIQRVSFGMDPAFAGAAAIARGVLAWRTDHRVVVFDADGATVDEIAAPPGQHVVALAAAGERAVAILEDAKPERQLRELVLAPKLQWGKPLAPTVDALGDRLVIGPTGKRLVVARQHTPPEVAAIDLATGLVKTLPAPTTIGLAMPDDDHLVYAVNGSVVWRDLGGPAAAGNGPTAPVPVPAPGVPASVIAAGGGRAFTASTGELVIATPAQTSYLGYELQAPAVAAAAPAGRLLIGLGDTFALLDGKLAATPPPDLMVPAGHAIADLRWLAGDDWLVESSRITDGVTTVALVDAGKHRMRAVRDGMPIVQMLHHDASSHLVTLSLGEQAEVLRHDPGQLALDRVAAIAKSDGFDRTQIVPVAPGLANGVRLVVAKMRDHLAIRWVKDPRALDRGDAVTLDGSLAGVDAAGTAYVWQNDTAGTLELAMLREGKRVGTLPTDGPTAIWPDPKGVTVLAVGQRSISLIDGDGKRRWVQALQGVTEALWLDDGALAIISAAGIARIDAKTGDVLAARCGWRFGLSTKQHPAAPRVEPVCTQLR